MAATLATTTKTELAAPASIASQPRRRHRRNQLQVEASTPAAAAITCNRLLLAGAMIMIATSIMGSSHVRSPLFAEAFPSGAPEQACKNLKPGHGGEPSSQPSPFELTQDKLQVEAGDQIKVTLSSSGAKTTFKGLLVQALNEQGEPVGKFLAGTGLKLLDSCSAVTHSDREAKKTATLVWEAPSDLKGKETITFKGTVVHKFDEYYMNIKSSLAASSAARRRRRR